MSNVYELPDGTRIDPDEVTKRRRCEFCGDVVPQVSESGNDEVLVLGHQGDFMDVCLGCLKEGLDPEDIRDNLKNYGQSVLETFREFEGERRWDDE